MAILSRSKTLNFSSCCLILCYLPALAGVPIPVKQAYTCSCWAAAAAMILSARNNVPYTELNAALKLGVTFAAKVEPGDPDDTCQKRGVSLSELPLLASKLSMKIYPPNNPSLSQWRVMLTKEPVWAGIGVQDGSGQWMGHVLVVTHIADDGSNDPDTTYVDPSDGLFHIVKFSQLLNKLEQYPKMNPAWKTLTIQYLYKE